MESSRQDLSNDMDKHRPILKKKQKKRATSVLVPYPKTGVAFPKTDDLLFTVLLPR